MMALNARRAAFTAFRSTKMMTTHPSSNLIAKDELSALLDAAADAIIVIDADGTIENFNPEAERIFGYMREEVIGKNVKMLMPEPYHSNHDQYLRHHIETNERRIIGIGREITALRANGTTFPADLSVGRADTDSELHFVGILRDLTQRKAFEAEIAKQRQELSRISRQATAGELAAALAHELNQPLSAIATFSGAAKRFLAKSEINDSQNLQKCNEALENIETQSLRAGEVIQRMRAFVNPDDTKRNRVLVGELIHEIMSIAQLDARSEGVTFSSTIEAADQILDVDKIQIQQVLLNLVRNAVDATRERTSESIGSITVATKLVSDHRVEFRVSDNGPGIPDSFIDNLFEPFKSTKKNGMGMGLAISNSIIEGHGDRLRFTTSSTGCSFYFYLTGLGTGTKRHS